MMEHYSEFYFQSHYKIPKSDILFFKEGEVDNMKEYNNFMEEYYQKDLTTKEVFTEINNYLDIDSLVEYFVIGIYMGIWDWPNHNDGIWRNEGLKLKNNPYSDGRWRYISYDFDFAMGRTYASYDGLEGYEYDNFKHLEKNIEKKGYPNELFRPFLRNEELKNKFVLMFCDYANEKFNINRINLLANDYKDKYLDLLSDGIIRWRNYENSTKEEALENYKNIYIKEFDSIRKFFSERPKYAFEHMRQYLNLTGEIKELTILINGKGNIRINSIIPEFKEGKWSGKYIDNIPLKITAIPLDNFVFKSWSEDIISNDTTIIVKLSEVSIIKVNFEELN